LSVFQKAKSTLEESLEGYLDRLPPGKKRSAAWRSWQRQYFVARNGILSIYSDHLKKSLVER